MDFVLNQQAARVAHVNLRTQKHGEEEVLACDVEITADVPNTFLDQLSPLLRGALYMQEGEVAGSQAPLVADATHLPVLRFPFLGPQKFPGVDMRSADVVIRSRAKTELSCDVNKVRGVLKEGGTVELSFRLQFLPGDGDAVARLSGLLGHDVKISVAPEGSGEGQ